MKKYRVTAFVILAIICSLTIMGFTLPTDTAQAASATKWLIKPSMQFDALNFFNALIGDGGYIRFYVNEYNYFKQKFTPEVIEALGNLKKIKDTYGIIWGPTLSYLFSSTDDLSLEDMVATLDNGTELLGEGTYTEEDRANFMLCKDDLKTVMNFLIASDFAGYWEKYILPRVTKKIDEIVNEGIANYDIVPEIEKYLGHKLSDDQITLYLIYFAKPHGMKIAGTQYITDISNNFETILANAIHEMMHPPFSIDNPKLIAARSKLEADEFFQKKFAQHNVSYGYPTYDGFLEENCVDALEVAIREKFDLIKEGPRNYFKNHDGGVDGLGAVVYSLIQQEDYVSKGESFEEFLIRIIESGKLAPGKVEELYNAFMNGQ